MPGIRAGRTNEAHPDSGEWVFVDPGFAQDKSRSCGLLASGQPQSVTFSDLKAQLAALIVENDAPMNLVIEAPLSVAFSGSGNPTGRSIERRDGRSRYWYVGLGCSVLTSASYLLRAITDARRTREIRLFEGFVSFKPKGTTSNHCKDVRDLKRVIWGERGAGRIVPPEVLATHPEHSVISAFAVGAMDYGVPPVVLVGGENHP